MELTGKLVHIGQAQQISNTFAKREVVIKTNDQYPQTISLEFQGEKVSILDQYKVGQDVTIGINLRGREWVNPQGETKYFNTIVGWKISNNQSAANNYQQNQQQNVQQQASNDFKDQDSDLPF